MPNTLAPNRLIPLNPTMALMLCGEDDPVPTYCPWLVPAGWVLTDEVLDFEVGGMTVEAFFLEREAPDE